MILPRALLLAGLFACGGAHALELEPARQAFRSGEQGWARALNAFSAAASDGKGAASYYLALMHLNGMGTPRDSALAARHMQAAARAGIPAAMFLLSNMLFAGEGLPKDDAVAREWLEAAAAQDHPEAMQRLAMAVGEGALGFARDEQRAAVLMKEMAHAMKHRAPEP